jgi:EmrB/QacA subfamily drug resistance transporter
MVTALSVGEKSAIARVLPGLLLAMLLAMLDAMIVSTALPTVVADLGGFENLSWVVAAYLLTSTVTTPLWGKAGDLYGRKNLFITAVVIFLVGSMLCGLAQSMGQLIAFRALQGIGAGGLIVGVMTIIGILSPPDQRGRYQSYLAALSAVATVGGPLLGGAMTDNLSWRWAFYVNLPIGIVALIVTLAQLRLPHTRVEHRIDIAGALLLTIVATAAILVAVWGGTRYAWGSAQILVLIAVAVVALVATILVERRAVEPILSPQLFGSRDFTVSLALGFLVGIALYGSITFLPLFQQIVQGASATSSGLLLLPLLVGQLVTAILTGRALKGPSQYRFVAVAGGVALTLGAFLLSRMEVGTSRWLSAAYMVVFGVGLGFLFQNVLVIAQNSVPPKDIGAASGALTFFRSIGGTFGVSLFAAIFISRLHDALASKLAPDVLERLTRNGGRLDESLAQSLSAADRSAYVDAVANASQGVWGWAIVFSALAIVIGLLVRSRRGEAPEPAAAAKAASTAVEESGRA